MSALTEAKYQSFSLMSGPPAVALSWGVQLRAFSK